MAMKCEAIVPEIEVTFPAVMENRTLESRTLIINEDIGIDDRKGVIDLRKHSFLFDPCPPGSKFVMKITAEDGREWPRMGRYAMRESEAYWLYLEGQEGPEGWRSLKIKDIDSHEVQTPVGEIADTGGTLQPFPAGTITTITFCDGEWTCEIEEPVERKEVALGEAFERMTGGEKLQWVHKDRVEVIGLHNGHLSFFVGVEFQNSSGGVTNLGMLNNGKFYELPTEPQPTPEPAAEKEPDWLPMEIVGLPVRRAGKYLDFADRLLSGVAARQLSEVAARFADEQEFPGEALPIKYRDAYGEKWSYEICGNGDLELGSSVVSSVDECDRAIRAIRLYKRHLEAKQ